MKIKIVDPPEYRNTVWIDRSILPSVMKELTAMAPATMNIKELTAMAPYDHEDQG